MPLTETDAYNALMYLCSTDVEAAQAKALYNGLEDAKKTVEAVEFMKATGSAAEIIDYCETKPNKKWTWQEIEQIRIDCLKEIKELEKYLDL